MSRVTRQAREARDRGFLRLRRALRRPSSLRRWVPTDRGIPEPLKYALVVIVVLVIALGTIGMLEGASRTAEADVEIVQISDHAKPHPLVEGSTSVRYRFEVGGVAHEYVVQRAWSLEVIRDAKVCYDPADPRNHLLVEGDEVCG